MSIGEVTRTVPAWQIPYFSDVTLTGTTTLGQHLARAVRTIPKTHCIATPLITPPQLSVLNERVNAFLQIIQDPDMDNLSHLFRSRVATIKLRDDEARHTIFPELIIGPDHSQSASSLDTLVKTLESSVAHLSNDDAARALDALHEGIIPHASAYFDVAWIIGCLQAAFRNDRLRFTYMRFALHRLMASALHAVQYEECDALAFGYALDRDRPSKITSEFAEWARARSEVTTHSSPDETTHTEPYDAVAQLVAFALDCTDSSELYHIFDFSMDWHARVVEAMNSGQVNRHSIAVTYPYLGLHLYGGSRIKDTFKSKFLTLRAFAANDETSSDDCGETAGVTFEIVDWWAIVSWPYMKRLAQANMEEMVSMTIDFPQNMTPGLLMLIVSQISALRTREVSLQLKDDNETRSAQQESTLQEFIVPISYYWEIHPSIIDHILANESAHNR